MKLGVPTSQQADLALEVEAVPRLRESAVGSEAPHRFRRHIGFTKLPRPVESGVAAPSGLCHRTPGRCRAPRRPGVFGAQSIADTSHLLRRTTRRLGSLAPAVQMANTRSLFRGEGWGEGSTSPRFARKPTPHLTSPRTTPSQSSILNRGERDQTSGHFPSTTFPNQPGSLAKLIEVFAGLSAPNTPGLRPAHLRHSSF